MFPVPAADVWGEKVIPDRAREISEPPCAAECGQVLRDEIIRAHMECYGESVEAHVTWVPPLVEPLYEDVEMRCPHGVLWHAQPTSEQIAAWAEAGVE